MRGAALGLVAVLILAGAPPSASAQMSYQDLLKRPAPGPDALVAYGAAPSQFAELWLPSGPGPHPVVVMLHGGCWRADLPGVELLHGAAADLRRRGLAVWSIEYRRVGEAGGGYPGIYLDVAAGLDRLRDVAKARNLKLDRVVLIGHSAGGQLALWAAARPKLPATSPLRAADPLHVDAVVSLGGFSDLDRQARTIASACGPDVIGAMTGAPNGSRKDVYADTSPAALQPIGINEVLIHGAWDRISPPEIDLRYAEDAARRGEKVRRIVAPATGHFELIAPGEAGWRRAVAEVEAVLR